MAVMGIIKGGTGETSSAEMICTVYMTSTTVHLKKGDIIGQGYSNSPNNPTQGTVDLITSDCLVGSGNMALQKVTSDTCSINIGGTGAFVVSDVIPT